MIAIRVNSSVENIVCLICKNWRGITLQNLLILIFGVSKVNVRNNSESSVSQKSVNGNKIF